MRAQLITSRTATLAVVGWVFGVGLMLLAVQPTTAQEIPTTGTANEATGG